MAQPKNPDLVSDNTFLMTQVPPNLNATCYDITLRYVFHNTVDPELALLSWAQAAATAAEWQGRVLDITPVDNNSLPPSDAGWEGFHPFVTPFTMTPTSPKSQNNPFPPVSSK